MPDVTLTTLQSHKQNGEKIAMLTCYDATFAHAACQAGVDVLLVGDSLGMVLQGHDSTLPVSVEEMCIRDSCRAEPWACLQGCEARILAGRLEAAARTRKRRYACWPVSCRFRSHPGQGGDNRE